MEKPTEHLLDNIRDLRMLGRVTHYLAVQGYQRWVIDPSNAQRQWRASVAEVEASDSMPHDFRSAIRVFSERVGKSSAFDALVVSSLVYRKARLSRGLVKWDGVVRKLSRPKGEGASVPDSFRATVAALSLHVMVFDSRFFTGWLLLA